MKRVCIIHTGGTITMLKDSNGVLQPKYIGEQINRYVPNLTKLAQIDHEVLFELDSSNVTPYHWTQVAKTIHDRYDQYDGFVVLHGTDTMAYTATALSFMLGHLSKPVVLTGSQLPIAEVASDAVNNLLHAVRIACEPIAEVGIMFGHHLLRGNRSKKISQSNFAAFVSPNCLPLSELGTELRFADHTMTTQGQSLNVQTNLVTDVAFIKIFPGITNELILGMLPARTKGVIIEAYGTGNFPLGDRGIEEAIQNMTSQGIVTVIATQCMYGAVEYERYQSGFLAKQMGALSAQDMTSEAALIKLMWLLGQSSDGHKIRELYHQNLVGELTERK